MAVKHQVKTGDTLQSLAQTYLYNTARYIDIRKKNNLTSDVIVEGQILTIPDAFFTTREPYKFEGIGIVIADKKFEFFTDFKMKFDLDTLAPSFTFTAPYENDNEAFRDAFKPYSFADCEIYYKEELIITGLLMVHNYESSEQKTVTVSGYGRAGLLQDMTLPASLYPRQKKKVSLLSVSDEYCDPFGVGVDYAPEALDSLNKKMDKTEIGITDNISTFLISLANEQGLIVSTAPDGRLFYSFDNIEGKVPTLNIQPGNYNFEASYDATSIFSDYTCFTSANRKKKTKVAKEKLDIDAFRHQTLEYKTSDSGDLKNYLKSELGRSVIDSQDISLELPFWEDVNGKLLQPRDIITIKEPDVRINNTTEFIIKSVEFVDLKDKKVSKITVIPKSALNNEFERFFD